MYKIPDFTFSFISLFVAKGKTFQWKSIRRFEHVSCQLCLKPSIPLFSYFCTAIDVCQQTTTLNEVFLYRNLWQTWNSRFESIELPIDIFNLRQFDWQKCFWFVFKCEVSADIISVYLVSKCVVFILSYMFSHLYHGTATRKCVVMIFNRRKLKKRF